MKNNANEITILVAEDDEDDQLLIKDAFEENRLVNSLHFVENGEELMDYLYHRGNYSKLSKLSRPELILLDLNMPKKDGREALGEIKKDPKLRQIPVVVLTTSKAEEDIYHTYDLGVNSFITKPVSFESLVNIIKILIEYWFRTVKLPFVKR